MSSPSLAAGLLRSLLFEAVVLALSVPVYCIAFGVPALHGLTVMLVLSLALMQWAALHRWLFDWFDWHLTRRPAEDRSAGDLRLRVVSQDLTGIAIGFPLLIWIGGHAPMDALLTCLCFSAFSSVASALWQYLAFRPRRGDANRPARS